MLVKNLNAWHPLVGLSAFLNRCYAMPWTGKLLDLSVAMLFFASPDLDIGSIKWAILLLVRASALLPFLLTCFIAIVEIIMGMNLIHTYGLAPWVGYVAFATTFVSVNALKWQHQAICAFSVAISGLLLIPLWHSLWPTRAMIISVATWAVLSAIGILTIEIRKPKLLKT